MTRRDHPHADDRPRALTEQTSGLSLFDAARAEREADAQRAAAQQQDERDVRALALSGHEQTKSEILAKLRAEALAVYQREGRPVSANDIRDVLKREGFEGDRRVLGQVFNTPAWTRVGETLTACEGATVARVGASRGSIGMYEPTDVVRERARKAGDPAPMERAS